jgi:carbon storage regulator CsrA
MLVLGRFRDESIILRDKAGRELATITVVEARAGGKVKLGIAAPDHVHINRAEIDARIAAEGGWARR